MMGLKHIALDEREMPTFEWKARPRFRALSFDGIDDYVQIDSSYGASGGIAEVTRSSAWSLYIIARYEGTDDVDRTLIGSTSYNWNRVLRRVDGILRYIAYNGTNSVVLDGEYLNSNQIYDIAVVYGSGGYAKLYMDSVLKSSAPVISLTHGMYLIGTVSSLDQIWNGKIYLILIYNTALTDAEIKALYNDPLHPPRRQNLVLWLAPGSIDAVTGKWYDLSGNDNHGTIYGATVVEEEEEVLVL
ncbi:MAG: LamG domain-containing protein [Candidatus Hydrothermae bacterium]|nr:LamG domain-containing protein [Candidatus Hydrothermae bacterium]